jgi:hypothetical protein
MMNLINIEKLDTLHDVLYWPLLPSVFSCVEDDEFDTPRTNDSVALTF